MVILLSVYALNACQSTPLDDNGADDSGLEVRYSEAKESDNRVASLNAQLGAGYLAQGEYERALIKLNKSIRLDPNYALAHSYLGVLYSRLERPNKAEQQFDKALKLAPHAPSILNNYAIFLCEQKQFEESRKIFSKVLNNPVYANRANAYQSAAWCALSNDKLDMSESLYRKALVLNPNSSRSLLGMAKVNYKRGDYYFSWNYFERYYRSSIPDADALWLGINILNQLDDPDLNTLSSFELQLKSKYPDTDETKWFYQGKQEY